MWSKVIELYQIQKTQQGRLLKAILVTLVSLAALLLSVDSPWLEQHVHLTPSGTRLTQSGTVSFISSLLSSILGLDLIKDAMKLALLAVILILLTLITLMALFSWVFYVAGMAFLGVQLRSVFINYQLGRDVLYRFPGTTKPLLMRHWTAEEKADLFQAKLEKLAADYKCPLDIINSEALRAEALAQETREGLEKVVFEGFQRDYSQYFQTLNHQKLEASWSLADVFDGVCDFAYNHPIFCLLAAGATAAVIYWALRSGDNPINELRQEQAELRKELGTMNKTLLEKINAVEAKQMTEPGELLKQVTKVNGTVTVLSEHQSAMLKDLYNGAALSNKQTEVLDKVEQNIEEMISAVNDITEWKDNFLYSWILEVKRRLTALEDSATLIKSTGSTAKDSIYDGRKGIYGMDDLWKKNNAKDS